MNVGMIIVILGFFGITEPIRLVIILIVKAEVLIIVVEVVVITIMAAAGPLWGSQCPLLLLLVFSIAIHVTIS